MKNFVFQFLISNTKPLIDQCAQKKKCPQNKNNPKQINKH